MKKSLLILFCALLALVFIAPSVQAGNYPVAPGQEYTSYALPIYFKQNNTYGSITQQIYLASELTDEYASSGADITAIKFYYTASGATSVAISRDIKVFLLEIPTLTTMYEVVNTGAVGQSMFFADANNKAGTEVYDGEFNIPELTSGSSSTITITFDKAFKWDGNKNIVVTIYDVSEVTNTMPGGWSSETGYNHLKFTICKTGEYNPRFLHYSWRANIGTDTRSTWLNNIRTDYGETYGSSTTVSGQQDARSYVAKADFTITPSAAPTAPSTPEDLAVSNIGTTTADLSWTAVDGAESYKLLYSTDGTVFIQFATPSTNAYSWTGLTANTTYYVQVAAVNAAGTGEYSEAESFTTLAPHSHDGITFEPWFNASAMPKSGNYYLATDVALAPYDPIDITLTGNLNLCLNGHVANVYGSKIIVPDGKTLAIYDNVGGGKITGFVASEVGAYDAYAKALIVVYGGAELELHQGTIENTYIPDEDGQSYAIYSNGTLHLSGDVLINSNSTDIYLYSSNVITLDGAISNDEKHIVYKNGGVFTSGWSTYMSGEDPKDYFESASVASAVCLKDGEAALRDLLNLSENSLNSSIGTHYNQVVDVNLTRSLTSAQYNSFCLPFDLNDGQLQEIFGFGYDLEELVSTSLEEDGLYLWFDKVYSLEAGKPYLIQPFMEVVNPYFEAVTITETAPVDITTDYIDFKGTYAPTELEGGNKSLLFLGAGNELFYPESTSSIKAFRAYFELKGAAKLSAPKARIIKQGSAATGFDRITNDPSANKVLKDGRILILRDGKTYNVLGMECK